ncbi:MAG: CPBP family intramembrane metalloprotease [Candidatus Eremiobacteraeota bacterium]|nr:CPBP family intramembrane metalloprotease [Candidatus Eremiobacteraeota bacterium]
MRNNSTWAPSAPSPIAWATNAWSVWSVLLVVLGVAFCFIIVPAAYVVAGSFAGFVNLAHLSVEQTLIAQAVGYVPLGIFLLAVLPRISKASLYELGLRAPTARDIGIGLGGIAAMWVVVTFVGTALTNLSHKHEAEAAIALLRQLHTPIQKAFFAFIAIALAPMLEELTFRVFLFNAFTRYVPFGWAAALSGVIFGIVHAEPMKDYAGQLLTVSISLALGGVILAYVYSRTRCYWTSVVTHAGFNATTVFAVLFFHFK